MLSAWARKRCGHRPPKLSRTWDGGHLPSTAPCGAPPNGSRRTDMSKLAIVAADAVEVSPLVRGWKPSQTIAQRHSVKIFENDNAVVGFAGMGPIPARIAADAIYKHCRGEVGEFLSVGYAGALRVNLR